MRTVLAGLAAVFFVFPAPPAAPGETYFDQRERGWFWYETFPRRKSEERPGNPGERITAEGIRKRGETLFEAAVVSPTRENVRAYMEHQKRVLERSEEFARVWKRVLWESPALDATVDYPVSAAGAEISRSLRKTARDGVIGENIPGGEARFLLPLGLPVLPRAGRGAENA